jgi:hypothetical protein
MRTELYEYEEAHNMAHAERRDLYLRPTLISPDYAKEETDEETKRPRLTLRYLHELIDDIHVENGRLADQIDTLSNQLDELARKLDALDIWKEDDELAIGLDRGFAYLGPAAPAMAENANIEENRPAVAALEALESVGTLEAAETLEAEAVELTKASEAIAASTEAYAPEAAEAAVGSEAFAREWALIPLADSSTAGGMRSHAAGELSASLQERMIENVKEAARIAEEIAVQASAHAEARIEHQAASRPATMFVPQPVKEPPALPVGGVAVITAEPLIAVGLEPEPVPEHEHRIEPASQAAAPSPARQIRETVFRHESAPSASAYIPPRSERHSGAKKRSLWSRLFARESM